MFLVVSGETCTDEPFWDPRTPGPEGNIDCFGESSPFEINHECAYECPPGNDDLSLIGSEYHVAFMRA